MTRRIDLTEAERANVSEAVKVATSATLRYAAQLVFTIDEELAQTLYVIATEAEGHDLCDSWCCPVCEEVICDDGCPFEPYRNLTQPPEAAQVASGDAGGVELTIHIPPGPLAKALAKWDPDELAALIARAKQGAVSVQAGDSE